VNILIITTSFPCQKTNTIGGKFVLHEAMAYARNGANVKVLTPIYEGAPAYEKIEDKLEVFRFKYFWPFRYQKIIDPINPIYHNKNKILKAINLPFFIAAFLFAVLKHSRKIDIAHCQWTTSVLFALPFRFFRKYKIVTTARGSDLRVFPKWLNRLIMINVDASINCYDEGWGQILMKFPSNHIRLASITKIKEKGVIPLDLENILNKNPNAFKIVYLGRLDEAKLINSGFPILSSIESIFQLKKSEHKIILVYIGWGDMVHKIKEKISALGLQEEIFLLGAKQNPEDYLPFFDLGLGGALTNGVSQEMGVVGLPQIQVAHTKQNPYTPWTHKKNMLLFEPYNTDSLTENIKFAYENPDVLKYLSKNIKEDVKEYVLGFDEGGKKYLDAFAELLKKND